MEENFLNSFILKGIKKILFRKIYYKFYFGKFYNKFYFGKFYNKFYFGTFYNKFYFEKLYLTQKLYSYSLSYNKIIHANFELNPFIFTEVTHVYYVNNKS